MLVDSPSGPLEALVTGSGSPVTVFAHGIGSSIAQTRPFGSGVPGTRAFLHFRGHGASAAPDHGWTYAALAAELRALADHVSATQALGVSLGAHALLALVAATPDRFARLVFVIPASLDQPSPRSDGDLVADAVEARDVEALARRLRADQPAAVRDQPSVQLWARRQADVLAGTDVARAYRTFPGQVPLPQGLEPLRAVTAPALVVAQHGDKRHPVAVAERLAVALPNARLEVLEPGGVLWRDRPRLREVVAGFLGH